MGIFGNFFKKEEDPELQKIFEFVSRLLNDDELQNELIPFFFREKYSTDHIDQLPNAEGEFGRDPRNPIPCNGVLGELTYLSRLLIVTADAPQGKSLTFHRLGSLSSPSGDIALDKYELLSYDGAFHDYLYMNMYYTSKSRLCPPGYKFNKACINLRGTNFYNEDFPFGQREMVLESAKRKLGFPAFDPDLRNIDFEKGAALLEKVHNGEIVNGIRQDITARLQMRLPLDTDNS